MGGRGGTQGPWAGWKVPGAAGRGGKASCEASDDGLARSAPTGDRSGLKSGRSALDVIEAAGPLACH